MDRSTGQIVTCQFMPVDKVMAMELPGQRYEIKDISSAGKSD